MAYQPIVRAADSSLFGREALVRAREPSLPHPAALFAAAERLGRVQEFGHAIRDRVARTPLPPGEAVFVNLYTQELLDEALYSSDSALGRIAPGVILEITERSALDALPDLGGRIRALRELGFRIAVDDLGAGYAGLNSFAALEPDVVKLDTSLVRGVHESPIKQRLVASMAGVCKEIGTLVVAEGVETEAERQALVELGCDLLQGHLIGRPVEPSWLPV
jgi:EAL domain-containing protein (putative c-di-GMP-specific phosphodiesterase class I)